MPPARLCYDVFVDLANVIVDNVERVGGEVSLATVRDAITFAYLNLRGMSRWEDGLAHALLTARKSTSYQLENYYHHLGDRDHTAAQIEIRRWCDDHLSANHPAITDLVFDYLEHDAHSFAERVMHVISRPTRVRENVWSESIGVFSATWMSVIGLKLKQPEPARAFRELIHVSLSELSQNCSEFDQWKRDFHDRFGSFWFTVAAQVTDPKMKSGVIPDSIQQWRNSIADKINLERLVSQIHEATEIDIHVDRPEPTDFDAAIAPETFRRLTYYERLVPELIGAEEALEWLDEFQNRDEKFLWTILHGEGGMGKSRIALDWLLSQSGEWTGGFLRGGFSGHSPDKSLAAKYAKWRPEQQTILILDYAATHAEIAAQAFEHFAARQDEFPAKLRVVLLERYYSDAASYAIALNRTNKCANAWFRAEDGRKAFHITELEVDDFVEVYTQATERLIARELTFDERVEALAFFCSDDFRKKRRLRPLDAYLCALHRSQSPDGLITAWRAENLENYVLQHEATIWRDQILGSNADIHMATLATLMGGMDLEMFKERQKCVDFPTQHADLKRCQRVVNRSSLSRLGLPPVEPDPLGENMFRLRLNGKLCPYGERQVTVARKTRELWNWMLGQSKGTPK